MPLYEFEFRQLSELRRQIRDCEIRSQKQDREIAEWQDNLEACWKRLMEYEILLNQKVAELIQKSEKTEELEKNIKRQKTQKKILKNSYMKIA